MSDDEKEETLDGLREKKRSIEWDLGRMPIANITKMHERRIKELEQELLETDRCITMLNKPKVFIAI
jgi:hypothetical protein